MVLERRLDVRLDKAIDHSAGSAVEWVAVALAWVAAALAGFAVELAWVDSLGAASAKSFAARRACCVGAAARVALRASEDFRASRCHWAKEGSRAAGARWMCAAASEAMRKSAAERAAACQPATVDRARRARVLAAAR